MSQPLTNVPWLVTAGLVAVALAAAWWHGSAKGPSNMAGSAAHSAVSTLVSNAARPSAALTAVSHVPVRRVVLITIDTLRADQPWSGYGRVKTPTLSGMAARSVVYHRAYSLANTTGPSIGGMLASRYPSELPRDDCPLAGMDVELGVAQTLAQTGVWTAAAHGHPYFGTSVAPKGGFDAWRMVANVLGRRASDGAVTGHEVTDLAIELLKGCPPGRPSFLWVHYVDPHDKYVLHPSFPASDDPARSVYDSEVAYTDHHIGRLLQAIEASPDGKQTAVVVTADHGEAFGEHNRWRHGTSVYDEEVRVPLMVHVPGLAPKEVHTPRSTLDIAPTIAALFGVSPPSAWRGRSLLDDAKGGPLEERPVVVDCPALMNALARRAVVLGSHKVIDSDGRVSVFDVSADPGERNPLGLPDAKSLAERATDVLATLASVPPRQCMRPAYRTDI